MHHAQSMAEGLKNVEPLKHPHYDQPTKPQTYFPLSCHFQPKQKKQTEIQFEIEL